MNTKYSLTLVDNFTCLGADCPDDCCHGWNLHIDPQTRSKWQQIDDSALRAEIVDSISVITEGGQAVEVVQHHDDGRCVHLSKQGLCTIQQRCGHEYLPETCREYPRVTVANKSAQLQSAHLSCPGIIQLLAKQLDTEALFSVENPATDEVSKSLPESQQVAELLEQTVWQVMAENKYPLSVRVYYLTVILEQISTIAKQSNSDEKKLIKACQLSFKNSHTHLADIQKQHKQNKLKINKKNSGIYWQLVFSTCRVFGENELTNRYKSSKTFQRLQELDSLIDDCSDQYYLKYYNLIQKIQSAVPISIINKIDSILTKYLLVKFKNHGFPWYLYKNSLELTFLDCVIPYNQITLLLYLLYESETKISENDIIMIIVKVEKTVAHNTLILQQLERKPELLQIASYAACWINS